MWLKLCLLLIYITVLFILARILEAITWYETGTLSKRLLDPMTLSVLKLKALLEQRGVSFEGVVLEKSDLTELVEGSGPVSDEDVESASLEEDDSSSVTNFTSGGHFFEQVEDAKDSVWLIQVYTHHRIPSLGDSRWKTIRKKVARFGVRAGVLDCSLDQRYCDNKGWSTPRLLLALPGKFEAKANVFMHTYSGLSKVNLIYNWIREKLDGKVEPILNTDHLIKDWIKFEDPFLNPEIRTIFFTNRKSMPMFYSALSVKFPGRVKFGMVNTESSGGNDIMKYLVMRNRSELSVPSYMIQTAESTTFYGTRVGESLSFPAMDKYFRTLYPCLNDIFIVTIMITNVLSLFEFCLIQGSLLHRLKKFLWCFVKYNIILIMLWLPLVGLFQLPYLDKVPLWLLKVLRMYSLTDASALIRGDLAFYMSHTFLTCLMFLAYLILVGLTEYRRKGGVDASEQDDENYWNFTEMRTFQHLFEPVLIQPSQFGSRVLILQQETYVEPVENLPYIQDLSRWRCALPIFESTYSSDGHWKGHNIKPENLTGNCKPVPVPDEPALPSATFTVCSDLDHNIEKRCQEIQNNRCDSVSGTQEVPFVDTNCPEGFYHTTQCVICLDDYRYGVVLCGLPCSHTFHEACVITWLEKGNHYCPVCRWSASTPKHQHAE